MNTEILRDLYHKRIEVGTPPYAHLNMLFSLLTIQVLSLPVPVRLLTAAGTVLTCTYKAGKMN